MTLRRLAALGGVAGPVLFTAAWLAGSLRQPGHGVAEVQLSGLAAGDARDPQIMMTGFVVLGACSIGLGAALREVTAPRSAGPLLVIVAGAATMAAGLFRRDHMLLTGPGFAGESWHNQVHDLVSGVAYGAMLAAPLVLRHHLRDRPGWAGAGRALQVLAAGSLVTFALFSSGTVEPWNGVLQRAAVSLALTGESLLAARLLAAAPGQPGGEPAAAR